MTESVGIDFGPTSDLSPANWNSSAGNAGSNFLLSDLVEESGAPTPIDLLVEFNDGLDALPGSPGPAASLIPGHSNSLTNIDGVLVSETSITFTFSDLIPLESYEIFVFGEDHLTTYSQQVTVTGQSALPTFTQAWDGQFFVKSQVGGSIVQLRPQALQVTANSGGQIQIHIQETTSQDFAVIPALAIRSDTRSIGSLIGLDFDSVGNAAPTNWTQIAQSTVPWEITNLIDETGAATTVDLTIDSGPSGPRGSFVSMTLPAGQVPTHSNSLQEVAGAYAFDQAVMFTFSALDQAFDYEVYLFGGFPAAGPSSQDVTFQGDGAAVSFQQPWTSSRLLNDKAIGTAVLGTFATTITPTSGGRISILVERSQLENFIAVSGLAIRPVTAVRNNQLTVSIADTAVSEYAFENTSTITITRSTFTMSSLDVMLTSSDTTEINVASMVTIPAGQTSVTVPLDAVPDSQADGHQLVSVTATAAGHNVASDTVFVIDGDNPTLTVSLPATQLKAVREILESEGGNAYELQVTRNTEDISQPLTVNLSSTGTTEITVPAQVTIPANSIGVSFMVTAVDDSIADGTQVPRVSAAHFAFSSPNFKLYVDNDDAPALTVTFGTSSVAENAGAAATTATVTRNKQAIICFRT